MTTRDSHPKLNDTLRKKAEGRLRKAGSAGKPLPKDNVLDLIHELEVHQVELEMQNEELRRSQSELEQSRKKYFDLYDLAPVGYVSLDRDTRIQEINLTGADLLGASRGQLKGRRFALLVDPGQFPDFQRFCRQIFETGRREDMVLRLSPAIKPGATVLLSGVAIQDAQGDLKSCQIAVTDISARLAAEQWRERLIETSQDALIAIDGQARVALFNPAAEKIFGYSAGEILGQKVETLMAEPYRSEHDRYISRYQASGEKRAIGKIREVTARRKNGEIFPIELSITEIGANEEPRYAAFIRDVSERANLQSQLVERTRLATMGETAAQIAHEIANPLNGMAMGIELMQRQVAPLGEPALVESLARIGREVGRLKSLVFDFRDLSREPQYSRRPLSLNTLVEELCALHKPVYQARGIQVEVEMEPDLPLVFADSDRIKQVLLNLCKNAGEAMAESGTLTVRAFHSAGYVKIEVRDTGSGIPANMNVFDHFKTSKEGGSGLGLVIARQIVASHGGTLTYTSELGKGTSFFVALPVLRPSTQGALRN